MNSMFHKNFRLNDQQISTIEELMTYVQCLPNDVQIFLSNWFSESELIEVNTSGSTGSPKLIPVSKKHMVNSAINTGQFFYLAEGTKALHCLPTQFIAGKMMWVRALVLGWHIDFVEPKGNLTENIQKDYDFAAMTSYQVANSFEKLEHIEKLLIGGGGISEMIQSRLNKLKTKVFLSYGMTETVSHIAIQPVNQSAKDFFRSSGYPFNEGEFTLLPDVFISQDERNCLVIDAKNIADKELVTNDIVDITSGFTFKWLGRFDHVINSGGIKLLPENIELKLGKLIQQPFFVSSFSDDKLGERLVLFIQGKVSFEPTDLSMFLEKFEIPKEIISIPFFSFTATGKLNRKDTISVFLKDQSKKKSSLS